MWRTLTQRKRGEDNYGDVHRCFSVSGCGSRDNLFSALYCASSSCFLSVVVCVIRNRRYSMTDAHMITMKGPHCAMTIEMQKFCPYTGMLHGEGWNYCCPRCRTDMEEVKEDAIHQ